MQQEIFDQRRAGEFGIQEHTAAVQRSILGPGGREGRNERQKVRQSLPAGLQEFWPEFGCQK